MKKRLAWILGVLVMCVALWPLLRWAVVDATLFGSDLASCQKEGLRNAGACWPAVTDNFALLMGGRFPQDRIWRPLLVLLLGVASLGVPAALRLRTWLWLALPVAAFPIQVFLLSGSARMGLKGFEPVPTELWGGLALTWLLSVGAILGSLVPGLFLALARTSSSRMWRIFATGVVEVVRGVPLITLLFVGHFLFPLFLPREGARVDELLRAGLVLSLFLSVYSAEVWRGGLLAVPAGQREAARALSLSEAAALRFVVLPQAARTALPGLVFTFIGLFKDTSLVTIIGLYDLLGIARSIPRNPQWLGVELEPLLFAAALYVLVGMGLTYVGRTLATRWSYPT